MIRETEKTEKVVLITGATRGIGRSAALRFAEKGYIVVGVYRMRDDLAANLQKELQRLNPRSFLMRTDVSSEAEIKELFFKLYRIFPSVDVLVNNAGAAEELLLTDMSAERFRNMLDKNLMPVFYASKEYIVKQLSLERRGSVVNVSSVYGLDGGAAESHYSAAKAAIIGFTKSVAKEYAYMGIRANAVAAGAIATDMTLKHTDETLSLLKEEIPVGRLGSPEEVADGIVYLAEAEYVTGEVLRIAGGW